MEHIGNQLSFGHREKNFSMKEKEAIASELKFGRFNKTEYPMQVYRAEGQASWYYRFGAIGAPVWGAIFYNVPVIRTQPTLRRLALTTVPMYMWYSWHQAKGEELWWKKTFNVYQTWCVHNERNPRVTY